MISALPPSPSSTDCPIDACLSDPVPTSDAATPHTEWNLKTELDQVRSRLLDLGDSIPVQAPLLREALTYALNSRGKFLRPQVTLLAGHAALALANPLLPNSATIIDQARHALIEVSAVSEMIHLATLLHDDVLDEADLRRGRITLRRYWQHQHWGNTVSILSGDFLLAQASLRLAQLGNVRLVAIYSQVLADLCEGEIEQLRTRFQLEPDLAQAWTVYDRKSQLKTGSLFAAGCEAAGVIAGLEEDQIQVLRQFGQLLGLVFQLVDDLLDYTATEAQLGKPVMADLREGLINAPLLFSLTADPNQLMARLTRLFQQLEGPDVDDIIVPLQELREEILASGALTETMKRASRLTEEAIKTLAFLPDSPPKAELTQLAQSLIRREF